MTIKKCRICLLDKELDDFYFVKKSAEVFYYLNKCKECYAVDRQSSTKELREHKRNYNKTWRDNNRERWRDSKRLQHKRTLEAKGKTYITRDQISEQHKRKRLLRKLWNILLGIKRNKNKEYKRLLKAMTSGPSGIRSPILKRKKTGKPIIQKQRQWAVLNRKDNSVTFQSLYELYINNPDCYYCKETLTRETRTTDHVTPLSRGGVHSINNLVMCCRRCNCSKGNKLPQEWHTKSHS